MPNSKDLIHLDSFYPHSQLASLYKIGFCASVHERLLAKGAEAVELFRVLRPGGEQCGVIGLSGEPLIAKVPAKIARKNPPVVGDWVVGRERAGTLVLRQVLPRETLLERRAAGSTGKAQALVANVDRTLICMGLDRDYSLARLERWLTLVLGSGSQPGVVLTKAALLEPAQLDTVRKQIQAVAGAFPFVCVDVIAGVGLLKLEALLSHDQRAWPSYALVGSSGVGKSTLLNYLVQSQRARVQSVSQSHHKGRHTTSHRELHLIPRRRILVVDTPGVRELGVWGDSAGLQVAFAEIESLAETCRFRNCQHEGEPGCAIIQAIDEGQIESRRVESWKKLQREQHSTARRASEHQKRVFERERTKLYRQAMQKKKR